MPFFGRTVAQSEAAIFGHIGPDKCGPETVVVLFPSSSVCSGVRDVAQSISSFLPLKKILQCIHVFQAPSHCRLFS